MKILIGFLLLLPLLAGAATRELIPNSGFEMTDNQRATGWGDYDQGYQLDETIRHSGSRSIRCENAAASERRGASMTITLNQKTPAPLLISGWSKAENVGGSMDADYSIYVDLVYNDGTPLYGQVASFSVGTHDWQHKQALITPSKPLKEAHIYTLLRSHSGTAWFDDISAIELAGDGVFDSQPIGAPALKQASGWFAHDLAANTPLIPLLDAHGQQTNEAKAAGLLLKNAPSGSWGIARPYLEDTSRKDRAITIYYVERFTGKALRWWNDIRVITPIAASGEISNQVRVGVGATGSQSRYAWGCVTSQSAGRALASPPGSSPRIMRIGYHAGKSLFYIAFDLALTTKNKAETAPNGRARVEVAVERFNVSSIWGFRDAAKHYLAPNVAGPGGLWMPFTDPSTIAGVQDFGIRFHEGDNSIARDHKLGIKAYRYTEPMTWWMPMPVEMPRTYENAIALAKEIESRPQDSEERKMARALFSSGTMDETGRYQLQFQNTPWANGAVWVLNPSPGLPGDFTKARLSYTPGTQKKREASGGEHVDGEYLDSIEGWRETVDYNPLAIQHSGVPPTFDTDKLQPVMPIWFSVWELASMMRDDLHKSPGALLMANSTPWMIHQFCPLLDLQGTETNWNPEGSWRPDNDEICCYRRTLSGQKPYLLLQNTDFTKFGPEQMNKYFQRSLFYGFYPSMFSADAATKVYWENPALYNRDRELFKKFIPIVERINQAGWQPVTYASTGSGKVYVERWGDRYLTVFNDSDQTKEITLTVDSKSVRSKPNGSSLTELLSGKSLPGIKKAGMITVPLSIGSEACMVVDLE